MGSVRDSGDVGNEWRLPGSGSTICSADVSVGRGSSQSLFQAVQGNNAKTIASILGGPTELASSGDPAQDKLDREMFVQKYQEMHRLGREPTDR